MPTYSYECTACQHVTNAYHSMTAKPRVKCEACGGRTKRLLGTGAGIIFKGSGFYETDYKRNGGKDAGKSESKGESKSETKTESKGESKPDSKPAAQKDSGGAASSSPSKAKTGSKNSSAA